MAKNGYKVFDTDTHIGPVANVLEKYFTEAERSKLAGWEQYRSVNANGDSIYVREPRIYRRRLGEREAVKSDKPFLAAGKMEGLERVKTSRTPTPRFDHDPSERIKDMDFEGVDVNFMLPSGWFGSLTVTDDVALEMGVLRAFHRWLDDYCGSYPDRLGSIIQISGRDIAGSIEEIRKWGKSRWAWGIMPCPPHGMPLDHPDLEPVWAEAQEHDLVVALHTFTALPPYAPGGLDTWDNLFLQRNAAHPWCGQRNMAALIGAGVMDRYPRLRIATLEAGHGWLPSWVARMDMHAQTTKSSLPPLQRTPTEYVMSGRYFQSIEIPEGDIITNAVAEILGEDVLMYASDYPHSESHFPDTVGMFLDWNMSKERKRRLLWDNPVKCYARAGLK